MAPLSKNACALAALAALGVASAAISCPTSNPAATSCLCTSGCSINGDNTSFPWLAPSFPPPNTPLGGDTICATVVVPCIAAAADLNAYLGITGNIQIDGNSTCVSSAAAPRAAAAAARPGDARSQRRARSGCSPSDAFCACD